VPEPERLGEVLPFGLHPWGKLLGLLTGFLLLDLSYHLWRRQRAAWWLAVAMSILAAVGHLLRRHASLALPPALTTVLLVLLRGRFTVRSEPRSIARGVGLVAASLVAAIAYGALGFWLLHQRDFGMQFDWRDACLRSLRQYALLGNPDLVPRTRHASWFLGSLDVLGVGAALFAAFSLYRPLAFRLRTLPHERAQAARLLASYGRSSVDHFKLASDKSFFFGPGASCFLAYRAAWGFAIVLGDPVGRPEAVEPTLRGFGDFCAGNGWRVAFHQAGPDLLDTYRALRYDVLKVGEEGIVDLGVFVSRTANGSSFRRVRNRGEKLGLRVERSEPPLSRELLDELEAISNEWMSLPGRRERGFTLGRFVRNEIAVTPVFVGRDSSGRALAFMNQIPCWPPGDTTIDLMRHRADIPNGTMDFLFHEAMTSLATRHRRFSLGLAPLAGVGDRPGASLEERAMHQIYERLNRFFSYKGLRSYKSKFEPIWEERFLVYQGGPAGLVNAGIALTRVTEG
jgi:phosphatidylglycerol lysyltransferase